MKKSENSNIQNSKIDIISWTALVVLLGTAIADDCDHVTIKEGRTLHSLQHALVNFVCCQRILTVKELFDQKQHQV